MKRQLVAKLRDFRFELAQARILCKKLIPLGAYLLKLRHQLSISDLARRSEAAAEVGQALSDWRDDVAQYPLGSFKLIAAIEHD